MCIPIITVVAAITIHRDGLVAIRRDALGGLARAGKILLVRMAIRDPVQIGHASSRNQAATRASLGAWCGGDTVAC